MAVYLKDSTGCPILLFNYQVYRRNLTATQVLKKDFKKINALLGLE